MPLFSWIVEATTPGTKHESHMNTLGPNIRERREALGMTLATVAEACGVTKGYLSMVETGRVANPPSSAIIASLEKALRFEPGELRRAAAWQRAPQEVMRRVSALEDAARKGRELASWLRDSTSRREGGGKNLDKLYRTGQLRKRINVALGATEAVDNLAAPTRQADRVPLINKVAAGYPTEFTDLDYPARVADDYVPAHQVNDPDAFAATVCGESMLPDYREGDIIIFSPAADVADGCDCFVRLEPDHATTFKRVFFEVDDRVRLQPLNPTFAATTHHRERIAGLYRAIARYGKI